MSEFNENTTPATPTPATADPAENAGQPTQPQQPQQPENGTANTQPNNDPKKPEEKPKSTLTVEPIEFPETMNSVFLNSAQIRSKIDDMFRAVFVDYVGCDIKIFDGQDPAIKRYVMPGFAYVNIMFRYSNTQNGYHVLTRRGEGVGSDLASRVINTLNGRTNYYEVKPKVLEALEEFFPVDQKKRNQVVWNERIIEYPCNRPNMYATGFNFGGDIEVAICGLNLDLLLKKIYGSGPDGTMSYVANAFRSTIDGSGELVFNVTRMNNDGLKTVYEAMRANARPTPMMFPGTPAMIGYNPYF